MVSSETDEGLFSREKIKERKGKENCGFEKKMVLDWLSR